MAKPVDVLLTDNDHRRARRLATAFLQAKPPKKRRFKIDENDEDYALMVFGILAEIGFEHLTGYEVHETIYATGGDNGIDFTLDDGRTVQVRSNKTPSGDLYFGGGTPLKADLAVLFTTIERPTKEKPAHQHRALRCWGFMSRQKFGQVSKVIPGYGYGPRTAVAQTELAPLDRLPLRIKPPIEEATWTGRLCQAHRNAWCPVHEGDDGRRLPIIQCRMGADGHTIHCRECWRIERIPPQYRGRKWPHATTHGVVDLDYPPLRTDPFSITDEFIEFRSWGIIVDALQHPERLCRECKGFNVAPGQTRCLQCRTRAGEAPVYGGKS